MQSKYATPTEKRQEGEKLSQEMAHLLEEFLLPLLIVLDGLMDVRLVRTLEDCCVAILRFRSNMHGLLLSELGSYLDGRPNQSSSATAGTKRIKKFLYSQKWGVAQIDRFLMNEADIQVQGLKRQGKRILALFDESIIEKPESEKSEGLGPVVSSKAKRRDRPKRGLVFNFPPKKAITVVGMQWTAIVIAGMEGTIRVATMSWWTTKGVYATSLRQKQERMLRKCVRRWGYLLLYVFDRGYGTGPWIRVLEELRVRFVIRWKQGVMFIDPQGEMKKLWEIGRSKRYRAHKLIRDRMTGQKVCCDLWWTPIRHAEYGSQLYMVKARVKGHIWYLITNEPTRTEEQAWEIFFAYRRRWQIETSFRYGKSELAMESPRTKLLENRLKLLGIVTLVYAFLLFLLNPATEELKNALLDLKCHRTGKWQEEVVMPLYRLRWALSRLWNDFRPLLEIFSPPDLETIRALASFQC